MGKRLVFLSLASAMLASTCFKESTRKGEEETDDSSGFAARSAGDVTGAAGRVNDHKPGDKVTGFESSNDVGGITADESIKQQTKRMQDASKDAGK